MATRASLTTLINTNLNTGTSITAAEHRAVEQAIVDSSMPYNRASTSFFNVGVTTTGITFSNTNLSILSVSSGNTNTSTNFSIQMANTMPSNNYLVRTYIEGNVTTTDNNMYSPSFFVISTTQFQLSIRKITTASNNIRLHIEVISLD